jgi:hypothetical protein
MKLTGSRCLCRACGEPFNSTSAFDFHRTGDYDDFGRNRRWRTPAEMLERGMSKNAGGFWIERARSKSILSADRAPNGGLVAEQVATGRPPHA